MGDRYGVPGQVLGGHHMHNLRLLWLRLRLLLLLLLRALFNFIESLAKNGWIGVLKMFQVLVALRTHLIGHLAIATDLGWGRGYRRSSSCSSGSCIFRSGFFVHFPMLLEVQLGGKILIADIAAI